MARETVRLEGLAEVLKTLKALPAEVVSNKGGVIKTAARKALVPMRDEAKANVRAIVLDGNEHGLPSESTGLLEKSIGIKRSRPRGFKGEVARLSVSRKKYPRTEKGKPITTGKVGQLLEYGTEKMSPKPWIRPAYVKHRAESLRIFEREAMAGTQKALRKLERINRVKK
jgi:hypothetical protein